MAYGLDFDEIYYADHNRTDIGVLDTYEIDIDLAGDKDFKIVSPDPVIPIGGFWYIQDTEYGGIVDAFSTNSDEEEVEYTGRTYRGILNSHILDVEGDSRSIPGGVNVTLDGDGAISDDSNMLKATISDCLRELVEGFGDLFVVDEPDINDEVSSLVSGCAIPAGTTIYDAMMMVAKSIDFTFVLSYQSDKHVHITPILIQDYVDYLKGSKYDGLGFQTEITTDVVNHLISTAYDEEADKIYRIHFFTDANGGIQPYATVDNPIKDSQYILDKRSQVLTGIDEIAEYSDGGMFVVENYELLDEPPEDWSINFGSYYKHEVDDEGDESYNEYEAVGEEVYKAITKKPYDWSTNYSSYYIRSYDSSTGEWRYDSVSGESQPDLSHIVRITKKPRDWAGHYSEYSYKFQTGTGVEYRSYDGVTRDKYVRLTKKPSDWNTNFRNYYRKVYEKKQGGKKILVDTVKHKDAKYVTCRADDDKKNGSVPSFSKRAHYRKDSYTVAPTFLKNNCYHIRTVEVVPVWNATQNSYYTMQVIYHAPPFVVGEAYKKVVDHYDGMVQAAIDFFEEQQKKSMQRMELDDFVVNIGDIVGGTDEFTGTNVVGNITNIEAKIENGMIDVSYSITVEDYTTKIDPARQVEQEESEE